MSLTLDNMEQAQHLTGLKWVCCECLSANQPIQVDCKHCGKQRWYQLGLSRAEAEGVARRTRAGGYNE